MMKISTETAKKKIAGAANKKIDSATKTICAFARKKTGETNSARTISGGANKNTTRNYADNAAEALRIAAHNGPAPESTRPAAAEASVSR